MREVVVSEFVTMDGVMEDPGGAEGFEHGGWSFEFSNEEAQAYKLDEIFAADWTFSSPGAGRSCSTSWSTSSWTSSG